MNIFTISILSALIGALLWTLLQAIAYRGTRRNPSAIKWLIIAVAGLLIGSLTISVSYSFPFIFSFASGYVGADLINSIYIIFNNRFLSSQKFSKRRK